MKFARNLPCNLKESDCTWLHYDYEWQDMQHALQDFTLYFAKFVLGLPLSSVNAWMLSVLVVKASQRICSQAQAHWQISKVNLHGWSSSCQFAQRRGSSRTVWCLVQLFLDPLWRPGESPWFDRGCSFPWPCIEWSTATCHALSMANVGWSTSTAGDAGDWDNGLLEDGAGSPFLMN